MDAERSEPAGPWHAFAGRRPPPARPDKGPTRREIHPLARADAEPGVHAGLDEAGERRVGTQPSIRHEPITRCYHRVPLLHLGEIVGEEGRDHQLQEHTGARMEQPQEVRHGKATPRPLLWSIGRTRSGGQASRASSRPSHRRERCDDHATARRPRRSATPRCRSAQGGERRGAAGVWHGLDSRLPP
jgi:hypothetical protein